MLNAALKICYKSTTFKIALLGKKSYWLLPFNSTQISETRSPSTRRLKLKMHVRACNQSKKKCNQSMRLTQGTLEKNYLRHKNKSKEVSEEPVWPPAVRAVSMTAELRKIFQIHIFQPSNFQQPCPTGTMCLSPWGQMPICSSLLADCDYLCWSHWGSCSLVWLTAHSTSVEAVLLGSFCLLGWRIWAVIKQITKIPSKRKTRMEI